MGLLFRVTGWSAGITTDAIWTSSSPEERSRPSVPASAAVRGRHSRASSTPGHRYARHLREPGFEKKETIRTAARAAARGGFTTICGMPNSNPVNDTPPVTEFIRNEARRSALVNVFPIAAVTRGLAGETPSDWPSLVRAGAVAFSDDGQPVSDPEIMRRALEASRTLGALIIDHCEDQSHGRSGDERVRPPLPRPQGMPAAAEEVMVIRDIRLAAAAGARVHIAHLSVREAIRAKRGEGVAFPQKPRRIISCSTIPSSTEVTELQMNPP
jgi:dihydroorotase